MKLLIFVILLNFSALAALYNEPQVLKGTDSDNLECELMISLDRTRSQLVKLTINNQDDFFIAEKSFDIVKSDKIKRISTKVSSLNGIRELRIISKPNGLMNYIVIEHDKINYQDIEYNCNQLKLAEK